MPALGEGIRFFCESRSKRWMAGTSAAMTQEEIELVQSCFDLMSGLGGGGLRLYTFWLVFFIDNNNPKQ
jgi:hypothetical protein